MFDDPRGSILTFLKAIQAGKFYAVIFLMLLLRQLKIDHP